MKTNKVIVSGSYVFGILQLHTQALYSALAHSLEERPWFMLVRFCFPMLSNLPSSQTGNGIHYIFKACRLTKILCLRVRLCGITEQRRLFLCRISLRCNVASSS